MLLCLLTYGGLCNRMRTMAGVLDLARKTGQRPVFIWVTAPDLNASFHSLFDRFPARVIDLQGRRRVARCIDFLERHWPGVVIGDAWANTYGKKHIGESLPMLCSQRHLLVHTCENITLSADFSMFHPKQTPSLDVSGCIGVHIRRSDHSLSWQYSPTEAFERRMRNAVERNPQARFFLATDNPSDESALTRSLPGRILVRPKRSLDRNDPQAIADALADLWLLSRCDRIIGSYQSSFTDTAAAIGGVELEVVKVLPDEGRTTSSDDSRPSLDAQ